MTISAINTSSDRDFRSRRSGFPTRPVIGLTFFCGLFPIVGNVVSNTVIVFIGFLVSAKIAFIALIFLIVIHKLEYFLNSKIVGARIRNPIWLTLIGLIIGEKLMGVPGMILSPVILNYLRVEMSKIEVRSAAAGDPDSRRLNESRPRLRTTSMSDATNENPWIDICPGIRRRTVTHGETMYQMLAELNGPDSIMPEHRHPQEQIIHILSGPYDRLRQRWRARTRCRAIPTTSRATFRTASKLRTRACSMPSARQSVTSSPRSRQKRSAPALAASLL